MCRGNSPTVCAESRPFTCALWSAKSGTNAECRLDHPARDLSSVFLGWIGSGVFIEKLRSIVDGVRANQAFLPPIRDRLYRNVARSGDLGDGQHSPFAKAIEAALQSVRFSNVADRY